MPNLHVFLGDTDVTLGERALAHDANSYLVTQANVDDVHTGTIYTSLGDLNDCGQLIRLLLSANEITYCPPNRWSDGRTAADQFSMAWHTEHYISIAINILGIKVNNLDLPLFPVPSPNEQRKFDSPQLWVAGCSTTFGLGVSDEERYANILSNKLNLPVSLLAHPGASIPWAVDQILRSDVRYNDIVVLGVSTYQRITLFNSKKVRHETVPKFVANPKDSQEITLNQFDSHTRIYDCLVAIERIINFCDKIGAKLLMLGIHANLELSAELTKYKNFIFYHGKFGNDFRDGWADIGSDNEHPGPKTHQIYADLIISRGEKLGII